MQLTGSHIHFMGVGGIGMSALAELAAASGARVSGCDREESENLSRLREYGVNVYIGHSPAHVENCDLLVFSSAIPDDHPERMQAGVKTMRRGTFLAELMQGKRCIGVCGTHGKTTTTWMIAHILIEAGLDPTVFVGGIVPALDGNLRVGGGDWFVTELDESDESFLEPDLEVAVITNVESDHLHHYSTYEKVQAAFRRYAAGVEKTGLLICGCDTSASRAIYQSHEGRKIGYGLESGAAFRAVGITEHAVPQVFHVLGDGRNAGRFEISLPGRHNVQNALAAIAAASATGITMDTVRRCLATCKGVDRRMQRLGSIGAMALYTDYAHHPTEVRAAIDAARCLHRGPLLVVFQPHLYSRTRDYCNEFGEALARADGVILAPIYPAREEPLPGVDSGMVVRAVQAASGHVVGALPLGEIPRKLESLSGAYEAAVLMGAGDIWKVADAEMDVLSRQG